MFFPKVRKDQSTVRDNFDKHVLKFSVYCCPFYQSTNVECATFRFERRIENLRTALTSATFEPVY